ncbi:unnamed protein product, partial [Discosporangium mesarthrocarpum]
VGPSHRDVAKSLNNNANLLEKQGKCEEAEPLYLRSLAVGEKRLGPEHPAIATAPNNWTGLLRAQHKSCEAIPLSQGAANIGKNSLDPEHPHTEVFQDRLNNLFK